MTQSTAARHDDDTWKGRVEDDALLRGRGRFGDDVKPDDTLAAYFVRSPHAFAKIARSRRLGCEDRARGRCSAHCRRSQ